MVSRGQLSTMDPFNVLHLISIYNLFTYSWGVGAECEASPSIERKVGDALDTCSKLVELQLRGAKKWDVSLK